MPMHDWTRVDAGVFHDLHLCWVAALLGELNKSVLPETHYAMPEQLAAGEFSRPVTPPIKGKARSVAIRCVEGHKLVALAEIVTPGNKDSAGSVADFTNKIVAADGRYSRPPDRSVPARPV